LTRHLKIKFDVHFTSLRGNAREPVFITDTNHVLFLDKKTSFNIKIKDLSP